MPEHDPELAIEALRRAVEHGDNHYTADQICTHARKFYAFLTNPAAEAK